MYRWAFPKCKVDGSFEPRPFSHLVTHGAIPAKCAKCQYLFEGSCTRALDQVEDYQVLDHGPCPIQGSTFPVKVLGKKPKRTLYIPQKCSNCRYLESDDIHGFTCSFEKEKWGDFKRSLDWGEWEPKYEPIGIQSRVILTVEILEDIQNKKQARAVSNLKEIYPDLSTAAAIKCVRLVSERLNEEL